VLPTELDERLPIEARRRFGGGAAERGEREEADKDRSGAARRRHECHLS
jgi:hypothetical protein